MTSFLSSRSALARAAKLLEANRHSVLFVSPLLRAREVKMASALRQIGWKVVLIHLQNTPFAPETYFDIAIQARTEGEAHSFAKTLRPRICHAFSGAVDGLLLRLCRDKPGPLVIDLNDVFCPSLFNYCTERFEPTRECLAKADALCARDIQARAAHHLDGFPLPKHTFALSRIHLGRPSTRCGRSSQIRQRRGAGRVGRHLLSQNPAANMTAAILSWLSYWPRRNSSAHLSTLVLQREPSVRIQLGSGKRFHRFFCASTPNGLSPHPRQHRLRGVGNGVVSV